MAEPSGRGVLAVVGTPIGNLGDLTLRAVDVLRAADCVVAEDTRRARALLAHLGIPAPDVERIDAHATAAALEAVVARVRAGQRVALTTDAGTPVVSDPGQALVAAVVAAGQRVEVVPGVSAVTAALSVAGLGEGGFRFLGFLPREGRERREALALVKATPETVVLFESPHRLGATLVDLAAIGPARRAVVARELTKVHEELLRGTVDELATTHGAADFLGEITLVLGPAPAEAAPPPSAADVDTRIDAELAAGRRAKDVADLVALETGLPRREVYARVLDRKRRDDG